MSFFPSRRRQSFTQSTATAATVTSYLDNDGDYDTDAVVADLFHPVIDVQQDQQPRQREPAAPDEQQQQQQQQWERKLLNAIRRGNQTLMMECIEVGNVNVLTTKDTLYGRTVLHLAVIQNHHGGGGGNVERQQQRQEQQGNIGMIVFLIEQYPTLVPLQDEKGKTVLHYACNSWNYYNNTTVVGGVATDSALTIVELLIAYDPSLITILDQIGATALHYACWRGHIEIVKLLIQRCQATSYVLWKSTDNKTVLHYVCSNGGEDMTVQIQLIQFLVQDCKVNVNEKDQFGVTALHIACEKGRLDVVRYLIVTCHANIDVVTNNDESILTKAFLSNNFEIVQFLSSYEKHSIIKTSGGSSRVNDNERAKKLERNSSMLLPPCESDVQFLLAAKAGNMVIIKQCVQNRINVEAATDTDGRTALHIAVLHGRLQVVQYLCQICFASCNEWRDSKGATALHYACSYGQLAIVKYLVEQWNVDVELSDYTGATALHYTCDKWNLDIVSYLIENCHANIFAVTHNGETIHDKARRSISFNMVEFNQTIVMKSKLKLLDASKSGDLAIIKQCIKNGLNVADIMDTNGMSVLHLAALHGNFDTVQYFTQQYPTSVEWKNYEGESALHSACRQSSLNIVRYLVEECYFQFEIRDNGGATPLHHACALGFTDIVMYLILQCGSDVNAVTRNGKTALENALESKNMDTIEFLLSLESSNYTISNPSIYDNTRSRLEETASEDTRQSDMAQLGKKLLKAAKKGDLEILKQCIERGVNIEHTKDKDGMYALHLAAFHGHITTVQYLTQLYPTSIEWKDLDGESVLHSACRQPNMEIVKYLIEECEFRSQLEMQDNGGATALHHACEKGFTEIVHYLVLQCAANVNAVTTRGTTVLEKAQYSNKREIIQFLTSYQTLPIQNLSSTDIATSDKTSEGSYNVVSSSPTTPDHTKSIKEERSEEESHPLSSSQLETTRHTSIVNNTADLKTPEGNNQFLSSFQTALEFNISIADDTTANQKVERSDMFSWSTPAPFGLKTSTTYSPAVPMKSEDSYHYFSSYQTGREFTKTLVDSTKDNKEFFSTYQTELKSDESLANNNVASARSLTLSSCKSPPNSAHWEKVDTIYEENSAVSSQSFSSSQTTALQSTTTSSDDQLDFVESLDVDREKIRRVIIGIDPDPAILSNLYARHCTNNYDFQHKIGIGAFGTVYHGYDDELRCTPSTFAFKRVLRVTDVAPERLHAVLKSFQKEISTLKRAKHPNIVALYGYHMKPQSDSSFLVYELLERGNLAAFLKTEDGRISLPYLRRLRIMSECLRALNFLHTGGCHKLLPTGKCVRVKIWHRDVKPYNIALAKDWTAKLIDCGLARIERMEQPTDDGGSTIFSSLNGLQLAGTEGYICRAYWNGMRPYQSACDIYSFGIVMIELITGTLNRSDRNYPEDFFHSFIATMMGVPIEDGISKLIERRDSIVVWNEVDLPKLCALALQCISFDITKRPTAKTLVYEISKMLLRGEFGELPGPTSLGGTSSNTPKCSVCNERGEQWLKCQEKHVLCNQCITQEAIAASNQGNKLVSCPMKECPCTFNVKNDFYGIIPRDIYNKMVLEGQLFERLQRIEHIQNQVVSDVSLVCKGVNCGLQALANLSTVCGGSSCPSLVWIIPGPSQRISNNPRTWLAGLAEVSIKVYFICQHSLEPVSQPVVLKVHKKWLRRVAPACKVTLFLLRLTTAAVFGLPFPIAIGNTSDQVQMAEEFVDSLLDTQQCALINEAANKFLNGKQLHLESNTQIKELTGQAYELLADGVRTGGQSAWKDELKPVLNEHGTTIWVKNVHVDDYKLYT